MIMTRVVMVMMLLKLIVMQFWVGGIVYMSDHVVAMDRLQN